MYTVTYCYLLSLSHEYVFTTKPQNLQITTNDEQTSKKESNWNKQDEEGIHITDILLSGHFYTRCLIVHQLKRKPFIYYNISFKICNHREEDLLQNQMLQNFWPN